jgi:integrase
VPGTRGSWDGGQVWEDKDGVLTYVIRRQVGGKRYEVSTTGEPVRLTSALAKLFLAWSGAAEREGGKGNSRLWVLQQKAYLSWWADQLKGRDLRSVSLRDHVIPLLDGQPGRKHRVEVLKAFFGWLRKERRLITRAQDVMLDLPVPARRPEQWRRPKAIPRTAYLRVLMKLEGDHRDALLLLDETGWHVSELVRFVRGGSVEAMPPGREDGVAVVVCPQRKSGETMRTAVGFKAKVAADRLREKASFSVGRFYDAVKAACAKAKVEPFTPGRFRHTLATRAIEAGADPAAVAAYLGHKSAATTKRWYSTLAVVPRVKR